MATKKFVAEEQRMRDILCPGAKFEYKHRRFRIICTFKPQRASGFGGEPKCDIYVIAEDTLSRSAIFRISFKAPGADLGENKLTLVRFEQIFGATGPTEVAIPFLEQRVEALNENARKTLVHGNLTMGYRVDCVMRPAKSLNRLTATKDNAISLDAAIEAYSGRNTADYFVNARIGGTTEQIEGAGIADYMCHEQRYGQFKTAQDIFNHLCPVEEYAQNHPLYLTCRAVNYRFPKYESRHLVAYYDYDWTGPHPVMSLVRDAPYKKTARNIVDENHLRDFDTLPSGMRVAA
jgi:hypothetical protein